MGAPAPRRIAYPLLAAVAAALAACAPGAASLEAGGGALVTRAWLHRSASASAPPAGDPGWREIALPDYWDLRRRRRGLAGWYRLELARSASVHHWAISLQGDWESLAIELDGRRLVDAGPLRAQLGDSRAGILLPLPPAAPASGVSSLALRFEAAAWRIGYLAPVAVGPSAAVLAREDRLALLQPLRSSFAWVAAACGLLLALLSRWDATRATPWFAAGTLSWSAGLLPPAHLLLPLAYGIVPALSAHAFPMLFAIGLHRRLALVRPRLERALLAAVLLPAGVRLVVPPLLVPMVDGLWWLVGIVVGFYLLRLVVMARRRGSVPRSSILVAGTAVVLAAGVHDLASLVLGRAPLGVFLFQYAPGLLAFCTAAMLVASIGTRLAEAERLNVELEDRVEARRRELASSYTRMAELESDRAIAAERERLMRDMHDGTGGALVSAIAMAEAGGAAPGAVAEILRDALADLRLSIDSLDPSAPDLVSLLGAARARLEPRFEGGGVRILWEVHEVPAPAGFGPGSALQVLRIFQEAVVNAMRHADARTVTVRTGLERDPDGRAWVAIEVTDDGCGFDPAAQAPKPGSGRGLGNMRRRAAALGGELAVTSGPGGSRVRLRLPAADGAATRRP